MRSELRTFPEYQKILLCITEGTFLFSVFIQASPNLKAMRHCCTNNRVFLMTSVRWHILNTHLSASEPPTQDTNITAFRLNNLDTT